ncbi:coiled-coil domain-containing protein 151 isoform X2 [Nerophis lumbriciformis]|uniref:coiled-coil domain-containing protein 151 isoform X2 n=1 Tax=Nerophis lumbriciformis TaxID=546530 RepID=UPI002ADFF2A0|nr:coiled-coil domain-containing protein 151 isoform X2 [Nerophis lumbriciformis]
MLFESENKPSIYDQIADLQRKLQLLESDRNAYYENSHSTLEKNRQAILQLREENRELQKSVTDADTDEQQFVQAALHGRGVEKDTGPPMSGKAALAKLEHRVASKIKRLNALKHTTLTHQRRLEDLKRECLRMEAVGSNLAMTEKEDITLKLRSLQNCLEKNQLKCKEGANIMTNYLKLKRHLQAELQQQEELFYKEHQEKDYLLAIYRKRVQEIRARAEKLDAQRKIVQQDELNNEADCSTAKMAAELDKNICIFEETLRRMKDATGYTNTEEVMDRYIAQQKTHQHLQDLKAENEYVILQLKERKEDLKQQFEDIKYSGETQLSSEQKMLEECEQGLLAKQQSCEIAKERLASLVKTLSTIQAGVEHLAERLDHISLNEAPSNVSPNADEFVVELLTQCERKLQLLQDRLRGKDLNEIAKDMEEEEFYFMIEKQLPTYNKRVTVTEDQEMSLENNEDESEEDDGVLTREALKRRSQAMIDAMSNKKSWKLKKK